MSDPFVQQLAELCRAHVTRSKWVIVPSHAIGRTIGERIALDGTNWLNLRFVTPLDVALRMGAPFLVERGIDPSEEGLGPALMMRLLLDLRTPGGEPGYFRPLAQQPTMAQALWSTVRELRLAGVKSNALKREVFESEAKYAELRALLGVYEQFLAENNRGDMATVYEEAVEHPDWCPIQAEDCWTELPDTIWTPLQQRLIDAMPGERILPRALEIPGATIPRRLNGPVERVPPDPEVNALAFLLQPAVRPIRCLAQPGTLEPAPLSTLEHPSAPQRTPALFHAGGREAEIEEVFRRILSAGVPLDQVEIACASDEHVALVWEKALRHDWPVTLGPGLPATATRPGRALLGFSIGSRPIVLRVIFGSSSSRATWASKPTTRDSPPGRLRAPSRAPRRAGVAQPMASRSASSRRATNPAPGIRSSPTMSGRSPEGRRRWPRASAAG
jgi:hypothetical protein